MFKSQNMKNLQNLGRNNWRQANSTVGQPDRDVLSNRRQSPTVTAMDKGRSTSCHVGGGSEDFVEWRTVSCVALAVIKFEFCSLDIPRLRETDVGEYKCTARNDAGTAEVNTTGYCSFEHCVSFQTRYIPHKLEKLNICSYRHQSLWTC